LLGLLFFRPPGFSAPGDALSLPPLLSSTTGPSASYAATCLSLNDTNSSAAHKVSPVLPPAAELKPPTKVGRFFSPTVKDSFPHFSHSPPEGCLQHRTSLPPHFRIDIPLYQPRGFFFRRFFPSGLECTFFLCKGFFPFLLGRQGRFLSPSFPMDNDAL